jgi:hypothetical protein
MDEELTAARREIASEIGADVGNFTPPEEKRFFGVEMMLVIGGAMLYAFFKAAAKKVGEKVGDRVGEKIGEPIADFVGNKIDEWTGKDKASQDRLLADAHSEVKRQIQAAGLKAPEVTAIVQTIETEMVQTLSGKAPREISVRIARKVSVVAVRTL